MQWKEMFKAVIFAQMLWLYNDLEVNAEEPVTQKASLPTNAESDFACDLYRASSKSEGNLFFSPTSVSNVLEILEMGANRDTKVQIQKVLHHLAEGNLKNGTLQSRPAGDAKAGIEFKSANRVWHRTGLKIEDSFRLGVKKSFDADVIELDFGNPNTASATINDWASDGTHGKIPKLLPGSLESDSQLIVANYVYFKADWATPFDPTKTSKARFFIPGKDPISVRMMKSALLEWRIWESPDKRFHLVNVPYQGDAFSATLLIPSRHDGLSEIEEDLSGDKLSLWLTNVDQSPKQNKILKMPSFQLATELPLNDLLKRLGMTEAFERNAHFEGISTEPLHVLKILHKAFVKVDELGSEAAAATVGIAGSGLEFNTIAADHPFLFMIRDIKSGKLLFMGRMNDPR